MKMWIRVFAAAVLLVSCSSPRNDASAERLQPIRYLALGDSYTIGQSVDVSERWPAQLAARLRNAGYENLEVFYRARTGWTTRDLLASLESDPPAGTYDLVSLLIGVNNQYQGIDIGVYQRDVQLLIERALSYTGGRKDRVFVVSIPDYAYTPFGALGGDRVMDRISMEIDEYNARMRNFCREQRIQFVDITAITRNGLTDPELVAADGLHPSDTAYALFVEEIHSQVDFLELPGNRRGRLRSSPLRR